MNRPEDAAHAAGETTRRRVARASRPSPQDSFAGQPLGWAAFERILEILAPDGPIDVRVSTSQVALRRRRGFAYLWLPGRYLRTPNADVVLSIALGRRDGSPRWKQVVEPTPGQWMHHLELRDLSDIDREVVEWLHEAALRAGRRS